MSIASKKIDFTNKKFGKLTIKSHSEYDSQDTWNCECSCGNTIIIHNKVLIKNEASHCGCEAEKVIDQIFGKLKVISKGHSYKSGNMFICKCECNNEIKLSYNKLINKANSMCEVCRKNHVKERNNNINRDISNEVINNFKVLKIADCNTKSGRKRLWECECRCGRKLNISYKDLFRGNKKYCGECMIMGGEVVDRDRKTAALFRVYKGYNDGDISFEEFKKLSNQLCFYCEKDPNNKRKLKTPIENDPENSYIKTQGLDRIDSSKKHNKDNIVPACKMCNLSKGNMVFDDFIYWVRKIVKNFGEKDFNLVKNNASTYVNDFLNSIKDRPLKLPEMIYIDENKK